MTTTLDTLLDPPTKDEQLTELLADAVALGFPTTSWHSGSVPRTLLEVEAETLSGVKAQVRDAAAGGFIDLAAGDWLTLLARGVFEVERDPGLLTQGTIRLTCSAAAGPYSIGVRSLWVSDALGRRYTNIAAGTLASGGTLDLTVEAEQVGSEYNVAIGAITILVLALPGVTVTNPDIGGGTWITQAGAGAEGDEALRARCRARWGTLGTGSTASAYEYWARAASAEVRRVTVREHDALGIDTDGAVTVVLAGETGTVSAAAVSAVLAYIAERKPLCVDLYVAACSVISFGVTGTLTARVGSPSALATAKANIESLGAMLRIGETVYRAAIIEQAMLPDGAVNFVLTTPATDVPLAWDEVVTIDASAIALVEIP